ncbi:MAG TPA: FAD-binding oxidoreductase [Methylomirabilota bacterium]|nr:FAD-binding oxidoreductase [Methylomirabilota bacterium]
MAPTDPLFAPEYKNQPYWWDATPRPQLPPPTLPAQADVVVVGSGYTGLSAALQTARGGRSTLVLDAEEAGWGCSSRNGGQISTSLKPSFDELAAKYGGERAHAILKEGHNALAWIADFVGSEGLDCNFERVGRFHAAHNPAQYETLAAKLAKQPKGLEVDAHMVARAEQRRELGTDAYHGGAVYAQHAALDPARYHQGLLDRVLAAGASIAARCPATHIERDGTRFRVTTPSGVVGARNVIIATNGYTGALTPWFRRRVIPIGSYIIATEPLAPALMAQLMPKGRVVSDTRKLVYYYRPSPDRRRILFGGRVAYKETDPKVSAPLLHAEMVRIFPELASTRVSHSWVGFVAYTFDTMPHIGVEDGLHYAMGYCGSGVSLASYLGMRTGQQLLGLKEGRTALDGLTFETRPLYYGDPWFLGASIMYYRWADRRNR